MNAATDQRAYRLGSIDMLRGLVIVIMAIDAFLRAVRPPVLPLGS